MATTALKKIAARVKVLKKKHPNAKHSTLQKQAGREYRNGKLKTTRKKKTVRKAVARKPAKKKAVKRRRRVSAVSVVKVAARRYVKRRRRTTAKKTTRRCRVGGMSGTTKTLLIVGGVAVVGLLAYMALKKPDTTQAQAYGWAPTGDVRDNRAQEIVAWATAAGIAANAITQMLSQLKTASPAASTQPMITFPGMTVDQWFEYNYP